MCPTFTGVGKLLRQLGTPFASGLLRASNLTVSKHSFLAWKQNACNQKADKTTLLAVRGHDKHFVTKVCPGTQKLCLNVLFHMELQRQDCKPSCDEDLRKGVNQEHRQPYFLFHHTSKTIATPTVIVLMAMKTIKPYDSDNLLKVVCEFAAIILWRMVSAYGCLRWEG